MKNSINASVDFSFKGEDYSYTTVLDLDQLLRQHDALPSLHVILARQHGIDTYSYLYEVMQEADIEFIEPEGYASNYVIEGEFDPGALAANWQTAKAEMLLQPVAEKELDITDLNQHPAIKRALVAAYNLGKGA
ncbi:MAG: hypothetical protein NTY60_02620 [Proteobacteria bacterium]|nr:hypothetical protein [Pseudomonadota bacterium]